jgi:hypothetical protein
MEKIKFFIAFILLSFMFACNSENNTSNDNTTNKEQEVKAEKQLNISVLLDLSDRIDNQKFPCSPEHYQRDLQIIAHLTDFFKKDMDKKGAFNAKGKLKIIFSPTPNDTEINNIVSKLNINLSELDNKLKKEVFDNITQSFQTNISDIYSKTIESKNYIGADIWRFFKNDIKDYCISDNSEYRNILIILTDGYIYHPDTKDQIKNRTSFIGRTYIDRFRNNSKWKELFEQSDYGLIDARSSQKDLANLEILVLEISSIQNKKGDEDIIKAYLEKWFNEMGVIKFGIYNSDLPEYTKSRIEKFLKNEQ